MKKDCVQLVSWIPKEIKAKLHRLAIENHRTMTGQLEYMIEKESENEDKD